MLHSAQASDSNNSSYLHQQLDSRLLLGSSCMLFQDRAAHCTGKNLNDCPDCGSYAPGYVRFDFLRELIFDPVHEPISESLA